MSEMLTIIVPIYNVRNYLQDCVKSLAEQDYPQLEILLMDDGSTDGSSHLCDQLAQTYANVLVHHKENGGAHTARNMGLAMAGGEYVMFVDGDDWLAPGAVSGMMEVVNTHAVDVVRCNYIREFGTHASVKPNHILCEKIYDQQECETIYRQAIGLIGKELRHPENQNILASACFNIYRKALLTEHDIRFENIREYAAFVDGMFNIAVYQHMTSFAYVDKPYYHYRKTNAQSATANYRADYLARQKKCFARIAQIVADRPTAETAMALNSRIALSTLEMCLNAGRGKHSLAKKYQEIKQILLDAMCNRAVKALDRSYMPWKWKLYYCFIQHRMTGIVLTMTMAIDWLKSRGSRK